MMLGELDAVLVPGRSNAPLAVRQGMFFTAAPLVRDDTYMHDHAKDKGT